MGKVLGLSIGTVVALLGVILLVVWSREFLIVMKGVIPVILILGGGIAILAGFAEFKDTVKKGTS
ncbi:MAG: hypothetical protein ABIH74_02640 [Candidatus Omnitrophota bacterium]